jgi:hypothetical protein
MIADTPGRAGPPTHLSFLEALLAAELEERRQRGLARKNAHAGTT